MGALDEWRYCPRCGEAIEKRAREAVCPACGFRAYANSVPGVEAVIVADDGRVLLGRRTIEPGLGRWDFPGGFLDEDEQPLEGLRREVFEETGLEIEITSFVGIYLEPYDGRTVLCLTWRAAPVAGLERPGDDLAELQWFRRDELPLDELAFSHYARALSDALGDEDA